MRFECCGEFAVAEEVAIVKVGVLEGAAGALGFFDVADEAAFAVEGEASAEALGESRD